MNADYDTEAFAWMKLKHLVPYAGSAAAMLLRKRIIEQRLSLRAVFRMSERAFTRRLPEFGRGYFSRLRYENFRSANAGKEFLTLRRVYANLTDRAIVLYPTHSLFPNQLLRAHHPSISPVLYATGRAEILQTRSVAVVGARRTNPFVLNLTEHLTTQLAKQGFNVLSGLAHGVDSSAHRSAILADGTTTLVLPRGVLAYVAKPELTQLPNWVGNHAAISPFHPWAVSRPRNYLVRNRLTVQLSEAVVVMEAGPEPSGTSATARFALKQNVPVFVLSPRVLGSKAYGNADLITAGAIPFEHGQDLMDQLLHPVASVNTV